MSIIDRATFQNNITTFLPDNNQRLISEKDVRDRFVEVDQSFVSKISGFDVSEYSISATYNAGDNVFYNGAIYLKIGGSSTGINPPNALHWTAYSDSPFATDAKYGFSKKATLALVTAGTDNETYVTPYLLKEYIDIVGGVTQLADLTDVGLILPLNNGEVLMYNSVSGVWENQVLPPAVASLDDLTDVIAPSPVLGDALIFDGTNWVNQAITTGNIYNTDGTLTGNRVLSGSNFSLSFTGLSLFQANSLDFNFTLDALANDFLIVDNRATTKGAEYGADYILGYTDRTLPDWGNVKGRIATIVGIPSTDLDLGTFTGTIISDNQSVKGALQDLETYLETTFTAANGLTRLGSTIKLGGAIVENTLLTINNGFGLSITDSNVTPVGLQYTGVYNATFTNLSLITKGWVEAEESALIGNVVGANTIAFTNAYLSGNYTVKQAIDAIATPLTFTTGSIPFAGATGGLIQDNANLFFDDTNNILRARNISIGTIASSIYGLYMRTNTVTGNPLLIDDATAGRYAFIDSANKYIQLGTGDPNTPHRFIFSGANSTPPFPFSPGGSFSLIQSLSRTNTNTFGAGFIAQHADEANQQRLRITHHTDYSGVNSYLSRAAHFTLDRNGGSGNYTTNKFIFSCSNFSSIPNPATDVWEFHTYRTNDASIGLVQTKRAAFDGNGTLALFNAYTVAPYSASVPTSTEANSFKLFAKNYDNVDGKSSPYHLTEDNKTLSVRRAWHRDIAIEFHPSFETTKYIDLPIDSSMLIQEFIFDTNMIDSLTVSFRKSSAGSAGAFSITYPISSPLNTTEIDNLNNAIIAAAGSGFVTLQIVATFDLAWTTQASVILVTEPANNR